MDEPNRKLLHQFISSIEKNHFRTDRDSGANPNALMIWNLLREYAGLARLEYKDLPSWCGLHKRYHIIRDGYGCYRASGIIG